MISEKSKELCFCSEVISDLNVGVREQTDSEDIN